MDKKRKIALGFATLAVALGAGHMVQRNRGAEHVAQSAVVTPTHITPLAASAEPEATPAAPAVAPAPVFATVTPSLPAKSATAGEPQQPATGTAPVPAALTTTPAPATPPAQPLAPPQAADTDACRSTLDVMPGANGMLDLTLISPCKQSTRVVLRHGGLAVTARTSTGGALFTALPALDSAGEVAVMFPDGTIIRNAAPVDLSGTQRFAVQWMADDRFALNAFHDGAAFGDPGHIHGGARGTPGTDGWLIQLGDASVDLPMLAEVYTWPAGPATVALDIEAAVTEVTCDRELLGETLDSRAGTVTPGDITLSMPDCSAVGDFLVLNNLAPGMTTAAVE